MLPDKCSIVKHKYRDVTHGRNCLQTSENLFDKNVGLESVILYDKSVVSIMIISCVISDCLVSIYSRCDVEEEPEDEDELLNRATYQKTQKTLQ